MHEGAILAHGVPEEVVTAEMVEKVFGLPVQVISDPLTGTPLVLPRPRSGAREAQDRSGNSGNAV